MQNRGVKTWEQFLEAVHHPEEGEKVGHVVLAQPAHLRDRRTLVRGGRPRPLHAGHGAAEGRAAVAALGPVRLASPASPRACATSTSAATPGSTRPRRWCCGRSTSGSRPRASTGQDYERVVKGVLAKQGMVRRGRESVPLGLDERWVRRRSKRELDRLRELDLRVVGDIDELEALPVPGVHTRKVTAEQQLEAALDGLTFMAQRNMQRWANRRRRRTDRTRRAPAMSGVRDLLRRKGAASREQPAHTPPARDPDEPLRIAAITFCRDEGRMLPLWIALLRRAVRHREPLRRRRQLRGRLHRQPALRRAAHPADPRRQVQQHPDGDGRQPRALAARALRRGAVLRHRRVHRPRPGPVGRPEGVRRGAAPTTGINAVGSLGFNVVHHVGVEPPLDLSQPLLGQRQLAKFLPLMCKPAIKWVPGALERRHPRRAHAVRRRPRPVDVPHEVRRP